MKLFLIFVTLAIYVACAQAQRNCVGRPARQSCNGGVHIGHRNQSRCRRSAMDVMWYYHGPSNSCRTMTYLGCGGNGNRWCSLADCQSRCRHPRSG